MSTPAPMPNFASKVNITAVKGGNAADPSVWDLNRPLQAGDWFHVPAGLTLTWNLLSCPDLGGGYVEGVLDCGSAPGDKVMRLATLVIASGGTYACGSCVTNTPLAGTFTLTFTDTPIDESFDPGHFGTGFLTMGATVDLCGSANKTAWTWTPSAHAGATTLNLLAIPAEWLPGDQLLIPGCVLSPVQDEVVTIQSVSGSTVTLTAPLQFDHLPMPGPQGQVNNLPVGNLTRKIVFQSANPNGTRGHIMFMRDMMGMPSVVNACHFVCKGMGRTDALMPVTDPMLDDNGVLVPGTADNPRARYAWHSHRQGQAANALQIWDSGVIWGFKKWGTDNHDSNVNATNMIGYDGQGACFATERGTEIGTYADCLGVRTSGSGEDQDARLLDQDFGHSGHGIWLQGPLVKTTGNVCLGHPFSGIGIYTRPPFGTLDVVAATVNGQPINLVPLAEVADNIGAASFRGHDVHWHDASSTISGPVSWGCQCGIEERAGGGLILDQPVLSGPNWAAVWDRQSVGIFSTLGYSGNTVVQNASVGGFGLGWQMPNEFGGGTAHGGFWANVVDSGIGGPAVIDGNPTFGDVPVGALGGRQRYHYFRASLLDNLFVGPDANLLGGEFGVFYPYPVLLSGGQQLYAVEQAADYVPFPEVPSHGGVPYARFPTDLVGLTNAQLLARYGLCVGFYPAPTAAAAAAFTNGLVGSPVTPPPYWYLRSATYPTSNPYTLAWSDVSNNGTVTTDPSGPVTLTPGAINLLTRTINGQVFTFVVDAFQISGGGSSTTVAFGAPAQTARRLFDLTIPVTASDGSTVNDGTLTVTIQQNGVTVLTLSAPVTNGVAKFTQVNLPVGSYTLTESYAGSATLPATTGTTTLAIS